MSKYLDMKDMSIHQSSFNLNKHEKNKNRINITQ